STISQLGYMFLGAGVGAYVSGIFHLYTHAAFKALLFLGAGAVIHALQGEQDIQRMGGLRPHMKVTAYTFVAGALANAGIFPLAGFWSKDEILFAAFSGGHYVLWVLGLAGAFLTAFYMARVYFLTFEGQFRGDPHDLDHVHDAPRTMGIPLIVLAICSVVVGLVGIPPEHGPFHEFLAPVLHHGGEGHAAASILPIVMAGLSLVVASAGIVVAYILYLKWRDLPEIWAERFRWVYQILTHKYYVDELYQKWIVSPLEQLAFFLWRGCDVAVVDGAVNGVARMMEVSSRGLRRIQTGLVFNYVLSILAGVVLLLGYLILGG
ncbi:MAG: proton-conducting transporter membrane subunit, partial [Candidatus Methylomirabilales bacterium]